MKIYYDDDANLKHLDGRRIAVIGYGIQGQAQALNLRNSACDVIVGNIQDDYYRRAENDGFTVTTISEAAKNASVLMLLIPDQAQQKVYEESIRPNLKKGDLLIFAHGYSIHYKKIEPPEYIDTCLLAPRMPGEQIREYYQKGGGVPAFVDVHHDATGMAWQTLLAVAKGIGATKAGAMHVTFKEETEIDLFIEQFLLPLIVRGIRLSFDTLVEQDFTPEAVLMELCGSGEIGELLLMAAQMGVYRVWRNNASPTCQYGIFRNSEKVLASEPTKKMILEVLEGLRDGSFVEALSKEAQENYKNLRRYDEENENSLMTKTQDNLKKIIKYRIHR
jgi:ketol-acid reductoisomerase